MPPQNTGKAHLADLLHVAHQAVGDATGRATRHAGRGEQLAPGRDALGGAVARQHDYVARRKVIDERDLHLVGVLTLGRRCVHRHVQAGACAADELQRVVQRAHEWLHRLLHQPEAVERVGKHRGIQRLQGRSGSAAWWQLPARGLRVGGRCEHTGADQAPAPPARTSLEPCIDSGQLARVRCRTRLTLPRPAARWRGRGALEHSPIDLLSSTGRPRAVHQHSAKRMTRQWRHSARLGIASIRSSSSHLSAPRSRSARAKLDMPPASSPTRARACDTGRGS